MLDKSVAGAVRELVDSAGALRLRVHHEDPRVPGQGAARAVRRPGPDGTAGVQRRRSRGGSRRWVRAKTGKRWSSSRRRSTPAAAARAAASRSPRAPAARREAASKQSSACSCHAPDRPRGQEGPAAARRAGLDIARELYLGVVVDRDRAASSSWRRPKAAWRSRRSPPHTPEKIFKQVIDPGDRASAVPGARARVRPRPEAAARAVKSAAKFVTTLVQRVRASSTARCCEINPLVVTKQGERASRSTPRSTSTTTRCSATRSWRRCATSTKKIRRRPRPSSSTCRYVKLDGNIGCMVNGAGLAMATMDIIKHYGGDAGELPGRRRRRHRRRRSPRRSRSSPRDPTVKGIFVNIFGGIMKCDIIAAGVVAAVKEVGLKVPLVVRLEGTNVELGRKILRESGLNMVAAADMADGAQKIVACRPARRRHRRRSKSWQFWSTRTRGSWCRASPARPAPSTPSRCIEYGTNVVAGVTPGKGGDQFDEARPGVRHRRRGGRRRPAPTRPSSSCRRRAPPTRSSRRSPPGSTLVVCITEGIPALDMVAAPSASSKRPTTRRASSGRTAPASSRRAQCKIGIMPGHIHKAGRHRRRLALGHADLRRRRTSSPRSASASRPASASAAIRSRAWTSSTCSSCSKRDPETRRGAHDRRDRRHAEEAAARVHRRRR